METPTPEEKVRALDKADEYRGKFDLSDGWALKKLAAEVRDQDRKMEAMKDCILAGVKSMFAKTDRARVEFTEKVEAVLSRREGPPRDVHRCKCGGRLIAPGECEDCGRNFE